MSPGGAKERSARSRHLVGGLLVGVLALVTAFVAGMLVAAAVNPGYERHWYYLKAAVPFVVVASGVTYAAAWLLGARRLVAAIVALVLVAGMTGLVFARGFADQPDRRADEARNLAFKRTISRYPGATLVRKDTYAVSPDGDSFAQGFLNPSPGYATSLTFMLPRGATMETAVRHYRRAFADLGWTTRVMANCSGDDIIYEVCGEKVIEAFDRNGEYVAYVSIYRRRADRRLFADL